MYSVLPAVVPFSFGEEELNLDESVSATCSVTKGDLPLNIWWTFHSDHENSSENLTTNDGIVIIRASQKISTLGIEAVKARHRGNYTCIVQNRAGIAAHSAYLAINGQINILDNIQTSGILQFVSRRTLTFLIFLE